MVSSRWVTVMVGGHHRRGLMLCRSALLTWSYLDTFVPRDGESMAGVVPLLRYVLRKQAQTHG